MRTLALVLVALCLAAPSRGQDALAAAQALYTAAQYEEALKAFEALKPSEGQSPKTVLAIEQGRASCLLVLDRKTEAEQVIEGIVALDPFFKPSEDDAPPKIRNAFRDVRRRVLAAALQQVYQRAKESYEKKAFDEAVVGFTQALALLDDPDLVLDAGPRSDMRLVARAFGDLAKAASTPSAPPAAPAGASGGADTSAVAGAQPPPATPPSSSPAGADPKGTAPVPLYDAAATDVTPPVPQRTDVNIPDAMRRTLPGGDVVLEVVVSAAGTVETATPRQTPNALLGAVVARAALDWRYRPATKAGAPVRYRLMTRVVINR